MMDFVISVVYLGLPNDLMGTGRLESMLELAHWRALCAGLAVGGLASLVQ